MPLIVFVRAAEIEIEIETGLVAAVLSFVDE